MALSDRRLGRITVQDLRRDLREADEDRFRLTSALRLKRSSNGIIGVLFLLISGFISALWTSCARRSETRPVGRSESRPPEGGSFYALLI